MSQITSPFRPEPGRYKSWSGEGCLVLIRRESTPREDGSVYVSYDDDSFTCATFETFKRWGYQPVNKPAED